MAPILADQHLQRKHKHALGPTLELGWILPIYPVTHLSKEPEARLPCWVQPSVFLLWLFPNLYNLKNSRCKELYLAWWQKGEYLSLFLFPNVILRCGGLILKWLVPVDYME
jgi:hypothetical protein